METVCNRNLSYSQQLPQTVLKYHRALQIPSNGTQSGPLRHCHNGLFDNVIKSFWHCHKVCPILTCHDFVTVSKLCDTLCDSRNIDPNINIFRKSIEILPTSSGSKSFWFVAETPERGIPESRQKNKTNALKVQLFVEKKSSKTCPQTTFGLDARNYRWINRLNCLKPTFGCPKADLCSHSRFSTRRRFLPRWLRLVFCYNVEGGQVIPVSCRQSWHVTLMEF